MRNESREHLVSHRNRPAVMSCGSYRPSAHVWRSWMRKKPSFSAFNLASVPHIFLHILLCFQDVAVCWRGIHSNLTLFVLLCRKKFNQMYFFHFLFWLNIYWIFSAKHFFLNTITHQSLSVLEIPWYPEILLWIHFRQTWAFFFFFASSFPDITVWSRCLFFNG